MASLQFVGGRPFSLREGQLQIEYQLGTGCLVEYLGFNSCVATVVHQLMDS